MVRRVMYAWAAIALLALVGLPSRVSADPDSTGTWRLLSDPDSEPPTFNFPLGAYDPIRNRMLVIESGWHAAPSPLTIQVMTAYPEPRWSTLQAAGPDPGERFLASLTYDPKRDRLLLFAGLGKNDIWALNLSGTPIWEQVTTNGTPPPSRSGHSAIYDPVRDRLIVFGGDADLASPALSFVADTWALSLQSNTWSELMPSGELPHGREGHCAIYDSSADRMVVFAGHDSSGYSLRNDVWALSLGDSPQWTELHPAGPIPPPRSAFGAILDPVRHELWIKGGVREDAGIEPDDVWTLSLTGSPTWTAIATLDTLRGVSYPVTAYDPVRDRFLVCGGAGYGQSAALPLAGPYHWDLLLPTQPRLEPGPRTNQDVVYDSRRNRFLTVGGIYGSTDANIWSFVPGDTGTWAPLLAPAAPAYWSSATVYDSLGDRLIMTDGAWVWSLRLEAKSTWDLLARPSRIRINASAILDSRRNRLIVYGGDDYQPHSSGGTVSEVWSLALDGTSDWTLMGHGPVAAGSAGHAAFYDVKLDRMIVMGGYERNGNTRTYPYGASVWASPLDSALTWTILTSTSGTQPPSVPGGHISYDFLRDRLLVFSNSSVWSREVDDTGPWTLLTTTPPLPNLVEPVFGNGASPIVFDPVRDQALALFSAPPSFAPDQAWALSFGPPKIELSRLSVAFDVVEVLWRSPNSIGRDAIVQRRDESSSWAVIAQIQFNASGIATLDDHDVAPGGKYAYRLGLQEGSEISYTDSVWAMVPHRPLLALQAARPNPSPGRFDLVFSLPDAASARIDVFDLQGRRVLARKVGGYGPGTHVLAIGSEANLSTGVYLIQLTHAGQSRSLRAVVIR